MEALSVAAAETAETVANAAGESQLSAFGCRVLDIVLSAGLGAVISVRPPACRSM